MAVRCRRNHPVLTMTRAERPPVQSPEPVRIRRASPDDIPAMLAIEERSFSDPWTAPMLRFPMCHDPYTVLVAQDEAGTVIGYAVALTVLDEAELHNIAVHPDHRGRGIGGVLLEAICAACAARGARMITLEVRASNVAARALYARHGFTEVGRRRRYYQKPVEDGIILRGILSVSTGSPVVLQ